MVETDAYLNAVSDQRISKAEQVEIVDLIAADPTIGVVMPGCGGARKFRFRRSGGGKSGGYRVIRYFAGDDIPVFLLTIFGKGEKDSLNGAERNALSKFAKTLNNYRSSARS